MTSHNAKRTCEKCGKTKSSHNVGMFKGQMLCKRCMPNKLGYAHRPRISLEQALARVYTIKGYKNNPAKSFSAVTTFPSIMVGHKVKLVLVK